MQAIFAPRNLISAALGGVAFYLLNGVLFGDWMPVASAVFAAIMAVLSPWLTRRFGTSAD